MTYPLWGTTWRVHQMWIHVKVQDRGKSPMAFVRLICDAYLIFCKCPKLIKILCSYCIKFGNSPVMPWWMYSCVCKFTQIKMYHYHFFFLEEVNSAPWWWAEEQVVHHGPTPVWCQGTLCDPWEGICAKTKGQSQNSLNPFLCGFKGEVQ